MTADLRQLHQQAANALQRGQLAEAEQLLEHAPKNLNFDFLRATLWLMQGAFDAAAAAFSELRAQHPGWHEATYNLIQCELGRKHNRAAFDLAQAILPQVPSPIPALLLAQAAEALGDQAAANTALAEALGRGAKSDTVISNLWLGRRKLWDWREPLPAFTEDDLTPAAATVLSDDPAFQRRVAERWVRQHFPQLPPAPPRRRIEGRLRIGYLSSDIHHHATAYLIAGLFAHHDRERFDVTCFSAGPADDSAIRQRIIDSCETFVDLPALPPATWADEIKKAQLDILIDLKGHTRGNLLPTLAQRPASIQIHYLGHPGTIGAPFIDYLVGDPTVTPAGAEGLYSERLIRLPHCYQINDNARAMAPLLPRSAYGLPDDRIVLACFNQSYKLTPDVFAQWAKILQARPQTVLWLYCNVAGAEANLRAHMHDLGLGDDRLIIAGPLPNDQHLERYQAADLVLDTYPYTSHTTGSDALWAGVPLVTRRGDTYPSRVAASLLHTIGLDELVTTSSADYQTLIFDLIDDAPRRACLRTRLQQARTTSPLFDTAGWVRDWETALMKTTSAARS